jgi:hypothetical protein
LRRLWQERFHEERLSPQTHDFAVIKSSKVVPFPLSKAWRR